MDQPIQHNNGITNLMREATTKLLPGTDFAIRVFEFSSQQCPTRGEVFQLTCETDGTQHFHFRHGILVGHFQYDPYVGRDQFRIKTPQSELIQRGEEILRELKVADVKVAAYFTRPSREGLVIVNNHRIIAPMLGNRERSDILAEFDPKKDREIGTHDSSLKWLHLTSHSAGFSLRFTEVDQILEDERHYVVDIGRDGSFSSFGEIKKFIRTDINQNEHPRLQLCANRILLHWYESKMTDGLDLSKLAI